MKKKVMAVALAAATVVSMVGATGCLLYTSRCV